MLGLIQMCWINVAFPLSCFRPLIQYLGKFGSENEKNYNGEWRLKMKRVKKSWYKVLLISRKTIYSIYFKFLLMESL